MEELYKLKEMLCDELETYGKKGELTAGSLDIVDKLSHALKSITTIIAMEDSGYSETPYPMNSYRGSSYRGRKRDSMGRYSRMYSGAHDDIVEQLRDMMMDAPDHETKQELQRLVSKLEKM